MSLAGFACGFAKGWLLTLYLIAAFPVLTAIAFTMTSAIQSGYSEIIKSYSQSAGYAEQALSAIRVVHSYGMEHVEERNYTKYLQIARSVGLKAACKESVGISILKSCIFFFYAYAFYMGSRLVTDPDVKNTNGERY